MNKTSILSSIIIFFTLCISLGAQFSSKAVDSLKNNDWNERRDAIEALAAAGGDKAIDLIMNELNDDNSEIRQFALKHLGDLKADKAIMKIIEMLKSDKSSSVRKQALLSLANFDDPRVISAIEAVINNPEEIKMIKDMAVGLLGKLKK